LINFDPVLDVVLVGIKLHSNTTWQAVSRQLLIFSFSKSYNRYNDYNDHNCYKQ